tara:strand:+ start:167 stop:490 length:324 start_codon:yes stop_codon:yes gene_type:complete
MAITAELTTALPYLSGSLVNNWVIGVTFKDGTQGTSDYYESEYFSEIAYDDANYGYTPAATSTWSTVESLTALVNMDHYYDLFAEQYVSVTDAPGELVSDGSYSVPT